MEETNNVEPTEKTSEVGADGGTNGQAAAATSNESQPGSEKVASGSEAPEGNLLTGAKDQEASGEKSDGKEEKPSEEKKEAPQGAPESYADFKAPEGQKFDGQIIDSFKTAAKEANLSQDAAQKLLDEMGPVIAQRQAQQVKEISEQWKSRSLADKELSAEPQKTGAYIARVRDRFSVNADGSVDEDIKEFMSLPIGNHPGLLKLLARVGRSISEADFPRGGSGAKETVTPKDFYASATKR